MQSAAEIPEHSFQRKAALAYGGVRDYAGKVQVQPIPDFDLNRTIFNTLEGVLPRFVIRTRIAKEADWTSQSQAEIQEGYQKARANNALPTVSDALMSFLVDECDFDVEHADGSFLDHLYFCFEYTHLHYPNRSPLVMLLHSILGTGTNTFAMEAAKIPTLKGLMSDEDWRHVEAFPSCLRLLYDLKLRGELRESRRRFESLESIDFYRVIDNAPIQMTASDFWVQLNYQLIHLIDFLPVSNWGAHANDTAFIVFRDLYEILSSSGRLAFGLSYESHSRAGVIGETQSLAAKLVDLIPVSLSERMAAKSVRRFSAQIGHSMDYRLNWRV